MAFGSSFFFFTDYDLLRLLGDFPLLLLLERVFFVSGDEAFLLWLLLDNLCSSGRENLLS